jgi:hypothetical protein
LPAQRQVNVRWQDYVLADDAILIAPDSKVTTIDLTDASHAFQTAQGSPVTDSSIRLGLNAGRLFSPFKIKISSFKRPFSSSRLLHRPTHVCLHGCAQQTLPVLF